MQTNQYQSQCPDLIPALHAGDENALEQLFSMYNRSLLYFAKSIIHEPEVAEEIVADSFVKLWARRTKFENPERIKAFLYIATKNACLNHLKSIHVRQTVDLDWRNDLENIEPAVYVKIIRTELMQLIYEEVMKLPEKQREVFRLTYFEGLNTEEISDRLEMSATAVFANRSRAAEALRRVFKDKDKLLYLLILYQLSSHFL